ncbi:MAG: hypothetical protein R6V62_10490 [Candidatus Fermentibacteraceae bacterium]
MLLLRVLLLVLEVPLGLPVTIDYGLPQGYEAGEIATGEAFSVVGADGGRVTIVPLQLDTIALPEMPAFQGGDTLFLPGPVLLVNALIPDTTLAPAFAPAPARMNIPPGFPRDYLRLRSFWLSWGGPPGFPWLPVIGGFILLAGVTAWYMVRRRRRGSVPLETSDREDAPLDRKVMSLLEGDAFVHGDWKALYAQMESIFRALVAGRFGFGNPALTLYQMERQLAREKGAGRFLEKARPLMREIVLQIYANRGSSREKSRGFIELLAELTRREP